MVWWDERQEVESKPAAKEVRECGNRHIGSMSFRCRGLSPSMHVLEAQGGKQGGGGKQSAKAERVRATYLMHQTMPLIRPPLARHTDRSAQRNSGHRTSTRAAKQLAGDATCPAGLCEPVSVCHWKTLGCIIIIVAPGTERGLQGLSRS